MVTQSSMRKVVVNPVEVAEDTPEESDSVGPVARR